MDIFDWLLQNGTTLDAAVIVRLLVVAIVIEFFGIVSYWMRRF